MRTYTITEYEQSDYDDYEKNVTIDEIIENLARINRGYIADYSFSGEEDDFERYKLHTCLYKVIKLLKTMIGEEI